MKSTAHDWNFLKKVLFRFLFVYFLLYTLPLKFMFMKLFWNSLVVWVGDHILHLGYEINLRPNGSGDTTYAYLQAGCILVLAITGALIWSLLDRKRGNYRKLLYWASVYLRYYLAVTLLTYGFAKIFPTQFPFPSPLRLLQTYGDSSPMGLAWTFMGYSPGFSMFTGLAEALGGFFLFFRRTTVFGALLSITVLGNVVAMNFFYDIPVKLYSAHLLVIAVLIIAPDIPRLAAFFFSRQALPAPGAVPGLSRRWMRITRIVLKAIFVPGVVGMMAWSNLKTSRAMKKASDMPLYGLYEVTSFERNAESVPPMATDSTRWNWFVVYRKDYAAIKSMTGETFYRRFTIDTVSRNIHWSDSTTSLIYKETDPDMLTLHGRIASDSVSIRLKRKDPQEFTLAGRGFHWINEYPFNR